jgi:hypothetical protein
VNKDKRPGREPVGFSVPTHKSNIYAAALIAESDDRKAEAFQYISGVLELVFSQALSGDKLSGYFLATLITSFNKRKSRLEQANKAFKVCCAKLEAARYATKRSSGPREKIEQIMFEALSKQCVLKISKRLAGPGSKTDILKDDPAIKLPLPDHRSKAAISKWSEYVYSELRKIQADLESQPGIGDLKRHNVDGKFQISRLHDRIPADIKRIFKVWEAEQSAVESLKFLPQLSSLW